MLGHCLDTQPSKGLLQIGVGISKIGFKRRKLRLLSRKQADVTGYTLFHPVISDLWLPCQPYMYIYILPS
jgi:hypothetical protein